MTFKWAYGVTTVPERFATTLPQTLNSLEEGGFPEPRLFVDGGSAQDHIINGDTYHVSLRWPRIGAWANWYLALHELHLRETQADRYVLFQDDIICVRNLRAYLNKTCRKDNVFWNLYTADRNDQVIADKPLGTWHESALVPGIGIGRLRQVGKGALGFVFTLPIVEQLLASLQCVTKCRGPRPKTNIDGIIVDTLNRMGVKELIHNPSLLNHTGAESIIELYKDDPNKHGPYPPCQSFPGEQQDALEWLK